MMNDEMKKKLALCWNSYVVSPAISFRSDNSEQTYYYVWLATMGMKETLNILTGLEVEYGR